MAAIQQSVTPIQMASVAPGAPEPEQTQTSSSTLLGIFQDFVDNLYSHYNSGDRVSYHINLIADQIQNLGKATNEELKEIFEILEIPRISVVEVNEDQEQPAGEDEPTEGNQEQSEGDQEHPEDDGESESDNDENYEEEINDYIDYS